MEFTDVVGKRYSIRQYKKDEVSEDLVKNAIEIAQLAPSAGNLQSYKVYITKEKLYYIDAPLYVVICADRERSSARYGERGRDFYSIQDATIFGAYLQLALTNSELASCWVGAFREGRIKRHLKIPEGQTPVVIMPVGYPLGEKTGRRRRKFEDIASWQK